MARLTFDADELRPIIAHALSQTRHSPTFGQLMDATYLKDGKTLRDDGFASPEDVDYGKIPAALHFVKDQGIYLMSSGVERDLVGPNRARVAYAQGAHPEKDGDWYEFARAAVGGDDFVEALPAEDYRVVIEDPSITQVVLTVTASEVRTEFVRRKRRGH
jgi:hypothetical protein